MKKNFCFAILGLTLILFTASCNKSNTTLPANTTVQGKWVGSFALSIGGPSHIFALTFKTNGILLVEANNPAASDIANGTWSIVTDSVKATYTYVGGTADTFSIAAKYLSGSTVLNGTIGPGNTATGPGAFSVTKE